MCSSRRRTALLFLPMILPARRWTASQGLGRVLEIDLFFPSIRPLRVVLRLNMLRYNSFIAEQKIVTSDRHRKGVRLCVILLAFVSGFVIMAIELLGGRIL